MSLFTLISFSGEKTVSPGSTVFGSHKVALKVFTAFEQTEVVVSLTVKACSVDSCIQEIDVIRKIRLQKPHDHEDVPHLRQKRGLVIGKVKIFTFKNNSKPLLYTHSNFFSFPFFLSSPSFILFFYFFRNMMV